MLNIHQQNSIGYNEFKYSKNIEGIRGGGVTDANPCVDFASKRPKIAHTRGRPSIMSQILRTTFMDGPIELERSKFIPNLISTDETFLQRQIQ